MNLTVDYFERFYGEEEDPWGFRNRWYERRKRALTLAALPRERYRRGFEPGCSIGVLTAQLADRCDRLIALEPVPRVAADARTALVDHPSVEVRVGSIPSDWPTETFDLVVLSEVGYYLAPANLGTLAALIARSLEPGGDLIAVHWREAVADYPSTAEHVHAALHAEARLTRTARHVEEDFLLEVFRHGPAQSVAQAEGLR